MEYLLDATVVYSGTGLATAATLAQVVRRYGVTQLGGQAGDNASDVASAGTAMAESYTDYVFIGCVLHIMQLIIVNACVVAYGDDCGMGVNTALRMVFIVTTSRPNSAPSGTISVAPHPVPTYVVSYHSGAKEGGGR